MTYDSEKFAEQGSNVTLYPSIVFVSEGKIHLKNNIIISEFCFINGGVKTILGNFIHISSYSSIVGGGFCMLEDFVGVSAGVRIITGSEMLNGEGLTNPTVPAEYRAYYRSFVHLEKHAFLSTNVVVHPGVTIGEGAVISTNSVVTKDVKPWTINAGTPARTVGSRRADKIKRLEEKLYRESGITPLNPNDFIALKVNQYSLPQDEL